jgi:hypothetical protein
MTNDKITTAIVDLLFLENSTIKNLIRKESQGDIRKDVTSFLNGYEKALRNHLNAAPKVPAGDGRERAYPEITHEHEPVPDASTTETSIPSKESIPNCDDFNERIEALQRSITTLFDDSADRDSKVSSMREAISAMNDLSGWLKQL